MLAGSLVQMPGEMLPSSTNLPFLSNMTKRRRLFFVTTVYPELHYLSITDGCASFHQLASAVHSDRPAYQLINCTGNVKNTHTSLVFANLRTKQHSFGIFPAFAMMLAGSLLQMPGAMLQSSTNLPVFSNITKSTTFVFCENQNHSREPLLSMTERCAFPSINYGYLRTIT